MSKNKILSSDKDKILLLGNEAIVRGALEAGVNIATTYPGTPASEIGDTFFQIAKEAGIYFEYSINEKVALEIAVGTSLSGLRAIVSMKHVGLNVAADALTTLAYCGVIGGLVIISADDPSCYSSQNEQDSRYYAQLANIPMLEPSTAQEAKDLTRHAFELSEKVQLPVLIRSSTRVSHTRSIVKCGKIAKVERKRFFKKEPMRFVNVPLIARLNHIRLLEQMKKVAQIAERSEFNKIQPLGKKKRFELGIVTSGAAYNYVCEALEKLNLAAAILKLGFTHPFPKNKVLQFIKSVKRVIVIEELEPYLERNILALNTGKEVLGKLTKHFPMHFEYTPDLVYNTLLSILGKPKKQVLREKVAVSIPPRPPTLCSGCPHRATFYAAKVPSKDQAIFPTDIGCYALGIRESLHTADLLLCMGAGVGAVGGITKVRGQKAIAFIGDSTFFHAGIPALINAVHNKHNFVLAILDNKTTAMTGHQPHPGSSIDGMHEPAPPISIEKIVEACDVNFLKIVDPYNVKETVKAFKEALAKKGVRVIILRHPCVFVKELLLSKVNKYEVNHSKCKKCNVCLTKFGCPAFYVENKNIFINKRICIGCGVCSQICPAGAIEVIK